MWTCGNAPADIGCANGTCVIRNQQRSLMLRRRCRCPRHVQSSMQRGARSVDGELTWHTRMGRLLGQPAISFDAFVD